nr:hypothetical protein [Thermoplasmata archaeon]NIS12254.1 hypothetical protein [Thermoplasmata archaeon]NIU49266.1 hypothetical protein [Thermoplasmata archaeon]NIV78937.1 hypothetical protein [Thermoplasmata archaeon]NIW82763.1 hypothetical protein [Thermoplasmata archaeon]
MRLRDDVPLNLALEDLAVAGLDTDAVRELFEELEFVKLVNELAPRKVLGRAGYRTVITAGDLEDLA